MLKKTILISVILFTFLVDVNAQAIHWNGSQGDGSWANPGNWDLGVVPNTNNDVFIDNAQVTYKGENVIKSLSLTNGAILAITEDLPLTIEGSSSHGIFMNKSQIFIEKGVVTIQYSDSSGLHMENQSQISIIDSLKIIKSGASGFILKKSFLENRGVILIDSTSNHGVVIEDGSQLENKEVLIIRNTVEYGLVNNDGCILFNNDGASIKIHSIDNLIPIYGILNNGSITNQGSIEVFDLLCPGIYSLETTASIRNYGLLSVKNAVFGLAALNSSTVINEAGGIITTCNVQSGIATNGPFTNSGKILVDSTEDGITLFPGAEFKNMDTLIITNTRDLALNILGKMDNTGHVSISRSDDHGIYSNDTLINDGSISMNNNGDDAFLNEGYLENRSEITIDLAGNVGLLNEGNGVLENKMGANISITSSSAQGMENYSIINNNGSISIDNSGQPGLRNEEGIFNNFNILRITNSSKEAIFNQDTIYNSVNGSITILDTWDDGVVNDTPYSMFRNEGSITLFRTAGDAIVNRGSLTQLSTGYIETFSTVGSPLIIAIGAFVDLLGVISLDDGTGGN